MISWRPVSARLLCARLAHRHGHLSVIVAYAPTEASDDADKFYQQMQSLTSAIPPHDIIVVLGDLNAVTGTARQGFESVIGNYGSGAANNNSTRLLSLCAANRIPFWAPGSRGRISIGTHGSATMVTQERNLTTSLRTRDPFSSQSGSIVVLKLLPTLITGW